MIENDFEQLLSLYGGAMAISFFISIVWTVLGVILFFKVWGMTNNVSKMKDMLQEWLDLEHPVIKEDDKVSNNKTS